MDLRASERLSRLGVCTHHHFSIAFNLNCMARFASDFSTLTHTHKVHICNALHRNRISKLKQTMLRIQPKNYGLIKI